MQGISLCFDHPAFPVLGEDSAPRRAFSAGGGIPGGLPGDDIFRGDDVGDELSGGFGGAPRGSRGSGESDSFQEVPAGKFAHDGPLRKIIRKFNPKSSNFFPRNFCPEISFDFDRRKMGL
jgi:hypothetical protein